MPPSKGTLRADGTPFVPSPGIANVVMLHAELRIGGIDRSGTEFFNSLSRLRVESWLSKHFSPPFAGKREARSAGLEPATF